MTPQVSLHPNSVGSLVGALIVTIFLFNALTFWYFNRSRILSRFGLLLVAALLWLLGAGAYISSPTASLNLFWTRICYTGVALAPLAFHLFVESLAGESMTVRFRRRVAWFLGIYFLASVALIWLDDRWLITGQLVSPLGPRHAYIAKGPAFPIFMYTAFASGLVSLFMFVKQIVRDDDFRRKALPLVIGFSVWLSAALYDGLAALGLVPPKVIFWMGPAVMGMALAIFLGRAMKDHELALTQALEDKDRIYQEMIRDELTGVYSRNYLIHVLDHELSVLDPRGPENCLLFIDLDDFKPVNDRLGHQAGDDLLRSVGSILIGISRKSDIAARFGGDEFVLLLRGCAQDQAIGMARRILDLYQIELGRFADFLENLKPGLSVGLSSSRHWSHSLTNTLEQPDHAMYAAKRAGKNAIGVYEGLSPEPLAKTPLVRLIGPDVKNEPGGA